MRLPVLALVLTGCFTTVTSFQPECDDIEAPPIPLPADCYEDELACPQDVPGEPWEATCGRSYMCQVEQVDGTLPFVCVRARDCGCLEEWAECSGEDVPTPGYCEL